MGWKWEVSYWGPSNRSLGYEYYTAYYGPSLLAAIWAMIKCKRAGHGCIKLEWRP